MRLIDADKLIELCHIMADKCDDLGESIWKQFATTVEWSPTIEAEPVTRCRDCEFYTEEERWCRRLGLCGAFDPNDYCSHAEERAEE